MSSKKIKVVLTERQNYDKVYVYAIIFEIRAPIVHNHRYNLEERVCS